MLAIGYNGNSLGIRNQRIVDFPPDGIKFHYPKTSKSKISKFHNIKKLFIENVENEVIPNILLTSLMKIRHYYYGLGFGHIGNSEDIIHTDLFLISEKRPWVKSVEHVSSILGARSMKSYTNSNKRFAEKLLSSSYCKKIMPASKASKDSMKILNCKGFEDKIEVVYPAVPLFDFDKSKRKDEVIRLLHIEQNHHNNFYRKGGRELLKAFEILNKGFEIELDFIGNVPQTYKYKYSKFQNINFYEKLHFNDLKKLFEKANIFVLPTMTDALPNVILEAMSFALPIISTETFAIPEVVKNGISGFLIKPEFELLGKGENYDKISWHNGRALKKNEFIKMIINTDLKNTVNNLVEAISILISNRNLREKMGIEGRKEVEEGKFSIKFRNSKLKRIYEEAVE